MMTPILSTKLYIPPQMRAVARPRLIQYLNDGLQSKLTLISAPAGFGKTTLVSEWIAARKRPTAWVSLDEGDNDLTRFLTYFIAALRTIAPNVGEGVLVALQSPQLPPVEAILTDLLNEIASFPDDFLLVLDDYHLINTRPIDEALSFLLDHLPPQMHLVITTREDPNIPLARLRGRRQLTEVRAADLRFTPDEASAFLHEVMGLDVSAKDIDVLETRTEGWIAGLQLAAISMRSHQDVSGFIRAFAGDNHYVMDYLIEEVLARQPEPVRHFLLQTAILDQMNGALCDAVTEQHQGQAQLEALNRGNFFLIPLDNQRHWYRYHHLFAEVLRMHLIAEQPDRISTLHRRASEWYEQNSLVAEAIRHALLSKDFARASRLIEIATPELRRRRQESTMLGWLQALPDEILRFRPVLSTHFAGGLLQGGTLEGVEARLQDAERWLDPRTGTGEMVVFDEEEFRGLAGSIAMYRAAAALAVGDVVNTMKHARRVPDLVPQDDHLRQGAAAGLMGLAYWTNGDLAAAHQAYVDCMLRLQKIGFISDAIGCAITLADIRMTQGRLHDAMRTYQQALQMSNEQETPVLRGTADIYVGMGEIERIRNNLSAATQHLLKSKELGQFAGLPKNPYRWCLAMAQIRRIEGDLNSALRLLDEAEQLYAGDFSPNVRPIAAFKTQIWIMQGNLNEAFDWASECGLSIENEISYLREFEYISLARVLLARYKRDRDDQTILDAVGFLERLLKAAEEGARTGSVIEILTLLSLAYQLQGSLSASLTMLERALTLAEPEGYIRVFVDEGYPMTLLLEKAMKHEIAPNYVQQLLRALGKTEERTSSSPALIEPLSEREREVLRLLETDMDGPDIARELMVSLNTLRTHTKNIYTKLDVKNRRSAVRRAEELGLL